VQEAGQPQFPATRVIVFARQRIPAKITEPLQALQMCLRQAAIIAARTFSRASPGMEIAKLASIRKLRHWPFTSPVADRKRKQANEASR
jgi:hypothetical protein